MKINNKQKGFTIVLGNEKGGTGKSTISMHLVVYLLRLGFKVGTIDIDARQGTLTGYINNRKNFCKKNEKSLALPKHFALYKNDDDSIAMAQKQEEESLINALQELSEYDFILIDTPGNDSNLSQLSHSYADLLITPLNDSFIDLDVLGKIHAETYEVIRPSHYAEMVWEQKKRKALRRENTFDWIIMRNRLSHIYAKNKEDMHKALNSLSKRIGFKHIHGFSERVIFRELFLQGLTVLDLPEIGLQMSVSHIAARQELRNLLSNLKLPNIEAKLNDSKLDNNKLNIAS